MKKMLLLAIGLISLAATPDAQITITLKKNIELQMPRTVDDEMPGTRGASVVWHPIQKKYYAAFCGNVGYPLAVFDIKGKILSDADLSTMSDIRGMWYNPATKKVCGNGYNDFGWFAYKLEANGIPSDAEITNEGMNQPDMQSVGIYNAGNKKVMFLSGSQVYMYNENAELTDSVVIHWSKKKSEGASEDEDPMEANEEYNSTGIIYTGVRGQELGFLNVELQQVELYDIKTGFLVKILRLPSTAATEPIFNFAYANGIYWLFDIANRKWVGYK
jgi:hypothetical protein